ncbi:DUF445 domain-containing protein [Brevibacillus laterosporus]|uniref:DUF445 domain-containing protein n=1 Tax=Brevibacillus laterosporus TaxID=1465 RepID=UPI00215BB463|nr:DUF445 family protein [Brevibacillus laterosporus]MCR8994370.1 DUF445 family protein [Brevibacillus laterosporus]
MNAWITLLLNVGIGSAIGGITNDLAIRMLFRPHREIKIGGFRVPFTPGLIPRRHKQISIEMGKLVENHLLTKEGVRQGLRAAGVEQKLIHITEGLLQKWIASDVTFRELIDKAMPNALVDGDRLAPQIRKNVYSVYDERVTNWLKGVEDKTVESLLSPEILNKVELLVDQFGDMLISRLKDYLHAPEGQAQVQALIRQLVGGSGGMLGGLVGMFLGDEKLVAKIMPHLESILSNPQLIDKLKSTLQVEMNKQLERPISDFLGMISQEELSKWKEKLFAKGEEVGIELLDKRVGEVLLTFEEQISIYWLPRVAQWFTGRLEENVDRLFDSLQVKEIVTKQVEGFPLERLEEMIIGISGREFRMITVLGFVLGAIIGLVQGLLNFLT